MYHSITFKSSSMGERNTYDYWHLVPASRPVINPPKPKTQYVDIPGADGSIDLTESLAGRPVFSDREGSIDFIVLNDLNIDDYDYSDYNWVDVYTDILQYLHGKKLQMILDDDPMYFYEGRFEVNNWTSDANNSTISINYVLSPYKYRIVPEFNSSSFRNGTFNQYGTMIDDVDTIARLLYARTYRKGDIIRVDRDFQFDLLLDNDKPQLEYISSSRLSGNSYTFSRDVGDYMLDIYYRNDESGRTLDTSDYAKMGQAIHYYNGGIL